MSVTVLPLADRIDCDRNGLPKGHREGFQAACEELSDFINELPDGFYHTGTSDVELAVERILARYLAKQPRVR